MEHRVLWILDGWTLHSQSSYTIYLYGQLITNAANTNGKLSHNFEAYCNHFIPYSGKDFTCVVCTKKPTEYITHLNSHCYLHFFPFLLLYKHTSTQTFIFMHCQYSPEPKFYTVTQDANICKGHSVSNQQGILVISLILTKLGVFVVPMMFILLIVGTYTT